MRIGRIGNVSVSSYVPSAQRISSRVEKPEQETAQKHPGWDKSDSYTPSQKIAYQSEDGRVTASGYPDYFSRFAANSASFDNFEL